MKFGIIFCTIVGLCALFAGIYYFKLLFPVSLIFIIVALINAVFAYKEYNIQKSEKIIYDEITTPKEVLIKYSPSSIIIAISIYFIFIILGVFILYLTIINYDSSIIFIGTIAIVSGLLIFILIKIIIQTKDLSKIIISINEKGIQVKNSPRYLWNEISVEKITTKYIRNPDSKHQNNVYSNYLYFFHGSTKIELNIDDFDITDFQLAQVLKIFRNRYNSNTL
ncbi:hypothetical protein [Chryseobacterium sp.]|uniref:hypothetical protein n=1 Tax=Chryseobacterium sp. TaxID=1871047 RepID=UPI0028A13599|nr:hypothetical protein [Chryseobacterium sp.]